MIRPIKPRVDLMFVAIHIAMEVKSEKRIQKFMVYTNLIFGCRIYENRKNIRQAGQNR